MVQIQIRYFCSLLLLENHLWNYPIPSGTSDAVFNLVRGSVAVESAKYEQIVPVLQSAAARRPAYRQGGEVFDGGDNKHLL